MARDTDDVDALVGLIYESAADPRLWSQALVDFSALSDSVGAHLIVVDKAMLRPLSMFAGTRSMAPDWPVQYLNYYTTLDPYRTLVQGMPTGANMVSTDHVTEEVIARSEFFQDYVLKTGGRHLAGWMLNNDASHLIMLAAHRREAPLTHAEATRWSGLATHFRRAVRLGMRLEAESARRAANLHADDYAGLASLLVDGSAVVLDASRPASRLLERGALLGLGPRHRLHATDAAQTRLLHLFVAGVAAGRGGGAFVVRGRNGSVACIEASPCGINAAGVFRPELAACALLCVHHPDKPVRPSPAAIRATLGCTPAEAEVAVALASGQSPAGIAAARGVSLPTVRSQIRALFLAADVTRIGQLVARITGTGSLPE